MLRLAAVTARRRSNPARFLASAKHAAKPRAPERDLSSRQLFAALGLRTFSREELRQRFDAADADADGYDPARAAGFGGAQMWKRTARRRALRRLDKDQDNRVSWDEDVDHPGRGLEETGASGLGATVPGGPVGGRGHAHFSSELGLGPAGGWCQRVGPAPARRQRPRQRGRILGPAAARGGRFTHDRVGVWAVRKSAVVGCLSGPPAMARPSWLGRAARNRRHAIEQASRRWRDFPTDGYRPRTRRSTWRARALTGRAWPVWSQDRPWPPPTSRRRCRADRAPLGASFNAGTIMGPAIGGGLAASGPVGDVAAVGGFVALERYLLASC